MKTKFTHFFDNKKRPKVLVIGDLILDEYVWGSVTRISPEAPVPVLECKSENISLGGAANVANNLVALGCEVHLAGGIGTDEKGDRLLEQIQNRSICTGGIFRFSNRPTTSKVRVIAHNQQVLRIDKEDNRPITEEAETNFIDFLDKTIPKMDGVICSDYDKGILTEKIMLAIIDQVKRSKKKIVVDPKGKEFAKYNGVTVITPNEKEIERVSPIKITCREDLDRAAEYLLNMTKSEAILVTRGKKGMILYSKKQKPFEISTLAKEVYDVTGAGDTVISVFGMSLFSDFTFEEAAWISNMAAGIVVGKIGTAVITLKEINEFLKEELLRTSKSVLELEEAKRIISLAKNIGKQVVFTNGCYDLIHGGHIEFLQQAKSKGDILILGLNSDNSVKRLKGPDRPIKSQEERANILSALQDVDYIVIFDEDTPENLIRELQPNILVKGDDYKISEVVGREIVEAYGGKVELIPVVKGLSTTNTVDQILASQKNNN